MIKRNCSSFNDPFTLKCLYTSIICPIFEYVPIIWETYNIIGHCEQLEKIQTNIIRFICFKCNLYRPPFSAYENILNLLNLKTLNDRKNQFYITSLGIQTPE